MRLKNVLLVVSDIEKSKRFYHELFGLQIVRDFGENVILSEGLVLQEQTSWEQIIDTHTVTGNASELFFEENNLDAFLCEQREYTEQACLQSVYRANGHLDGKAIEILSAKEYGVEFVGDVRVNSWGKKVVMLKDPDGHLIEVAET